MTSESASDWPVLPTETEIYILPSGEVIVADLPAELAAQLAYLSRTKASESTNSSTHVTNQQHPTQPLNTG